MTKQTNKHYPAEFKQEAVALVIEQDYSIVQAIASLRHDRQTTLQLGSQA